MKIFEVSRTANFTWSPRNHIPIYLACGTAAQQLDATFSTTSSLDIFKLDYEWSETQPNVQPCATIQTDYRFNKLVWAEDKDYREFLTCGTDNGQIVIWNGQKLIGCTGSNALEDETSLHAPLHSFTDHQGVVNGLDYNHFQKNVLASGSAGGQIFIWDLDKPGPPMSPSSKLGSNEDVLSVAWNYQVQQILASVFSSRCVVWDLRKSEPIIQLSESLARIKFNSTVCWHPEIATQLCLASEDDRSPVIQIWDLRHATSPVRTLDHHQKGIMSMAWCDRDPDLLMSCSRDNRILVWNPNSSESGGEILSEVQTGQQWSFDVQWCPRNPNLISVASFDGSIAVYSLMGGGATMPHGSQPSAAPSDSVSKVEDSFRESISSTSSDPFAHIGAVSTSSAPSSADPFRKSSGGAGASQSHLPEISVEPLKYPPKWMKRPAGASFGFGGKLLMLNNQFIDVNRSLPSGTAAATPPVSIHIHQVVTETELVERASRLHDALNSGELLKFCESKIRQCGEADHEEIAESVENNREIWSFISANMELNPRQRYLSLLGYNSMSLHKQMGVVSLDDGKPDDNTSASLSEDTTAGGEERSEDSPSVSTEEQSGEDLFDDIIATQQEQQKKKADDATKELEQSKPLLFPTEGHEKLVTESILVGDLTSAVDLCVGEGQYSEALILSIAAGPDKYEDTLEKFFASRSHSNLHQLLKLTVGRRLEEVVSRCDLSQWRQALAIVLTYAKAPEIRPLCDKLAERLEEGQLRVHGEASLVSAANLVHVVSGNIDRLINNWIKIDFSSLFSTVPLSQPIEQSKSLTDARKNECRILEELMEKVEIYRSGLKQIIPDISAEPTAADAAQSLAAVVQKYAQLLAAQGLALTAIQYLDPNTQQPDLRMLYDRLYNNIGVEDAKSFVKPVQPFEFKQIYPEINKQQQTAGDDQQQQQQQDQFHLQQAPSSRTEGMGGGLQTQQQLIQSKSPSQPQPIAPTTAGPSAASHSQNQNFLNYHVLQPQQQQQPQPTPAAQSQYQQPPPAAPLPHDQPTAQTLKSTRTGGGPGPLSSRYPQAPASHAPGVIPTANYMPPVSGPPGGASMGYQQQQQQMVPQQQQAVSGGGGGSGRLLEPGAGGPIVNQPLASTPVAASPTAYDQRVGYYQQQPQQAHRQPFDPYAAQRDMGGQHQQQPPPPQMASVPPLSSLKPPTTGAWNDPPVVTGDRRKPMTAYVSPTPITTPIYGSVQPSVQVPPPGPQQQHQQYPGPGRQGQTPDQQQQQPYPPQPPHQQLQQQQIQQLQPQPQAPPAPHHQQYQPTPNIMQPASNDAGDQQKPQLPPAVAVQSAPTSAGPAAPVKPTAEMPSEYIAIQELLTLILKRCQEVNNQPQMKRKLDDVSRKLNLLYDKLRYRQLSSKVTSGLEKIVQSIQQYDYSTALQIHTHLVSTANFSEISSFMPALKILTQCAMRYNIQL